MLTSIQNRQSLLFVLIHFLLCSTQLRAQQISDPCPQIEIQGTEKVTLSANEKTLICGDSEDPAYKIIPLYQAEILLKGFLQARGYLNPTMETQVDKLVAKTHEQSFIKEIMIKSVGKQEQRKIFLTKIQPHLDSFFLGQVLNPKQLNLIESEVKNLLKRYGHACAKVKTQALSQTGVIIVNLENDQKMYFGELKSEDISGLHPNALVRFYPFKKGQLYRSGQLNLAEKRFLRSRVVDGSYFLETCPEYQTEGKSVVKQKDQVNLEHRFLEGPPRLIRFGIGMSTEVGPMTRARWSNQRKGEMASYREINLQASFKNQQARALMDEYLWEETPRRSLLASVELQRDSQEDYEELSLKLRPHLKWTRDTRQHSWQWRIGPTFSSGRFSTDSAELMKTEDYTSTSIEGLIQTMSHLYELFDMHPEEGHMLALSFDLRHPDFGFKEPLALGHFTALKIQPLSRVGRGELIAAARLNLATTWVEKDVRLETLPPSVKHYGGGSDDLRGYRLNTLPKNEGLGALAKAALKMELRKTHTFVPTLESVVFLDMMRFGESSFQLGPTLWLSPGIGLRWLSPIGLIQTYIAQGLAKKPKRNDGQLYFIGIGGTF